MASIKRIICFAVIFENIYLGLSERSALQNDESGYCLKFENRVSALENVMKNLHEEKIMTEKKMDYIRQEMVSSKAQYEGKFNILEKELKTTREQLSNAKDIVTNLKNYMLLNGFKIDDFDENYGHGVAEDTAKREKRVLLPSTSTASSVAFSASLINHQENLSVYQKIRFDYVMTNVGSGYDPAAGVFKATVPGLYFFTVVIMSHATEDIETQIVKNGIQIVNTYSGDSTTWNQGSQSVVLQLNAGDTVYIQIQDNKGVNDGNIRIFGQSWSSFSGFLIAKTQ
ncbi:C1QL [Mytilus coruscus]|uniref:C1QL n=1 Tax=Mytilus coruscus TaxID=42192 RepID=A0A6J8CVD5_MYTCO|nr:C1QL [Mytilus coruscus]